MAPEVGGKASVGGKVQHANETDEPVKKEVREEKQGKAGKQAEEELKVKEQDEPSDTEEEEASDLSEGEVEDIFSEKMLTALRCVSVTTSHCGTRSSGWGALVIRTVGSQCVI
jgi:hypothetical protein